MFRVLSTGLLVGVFTGICALPVRFATDGKDDPKVGKVFEGKITKVDVARRSVTLGDVKTGSEIATGSDKSADKAATADKDKGSVGRASGAGKYTFELSPNAKITRDGKMAEMGDVQEGLYARIHASADEAASDKAKERPSASSDGLILKAVQIEVLSKAKSGGTGATKDKE